MNDWEVDKVETGFDTGGAWASPIKSQKKTMRQDQTMRQDLMAVRVLSSEELPKRKEKRGAGRLAVQMGMGTHREGKGKPGTQEEKSAGRPALYIHQYSHMKDCTPTNHQMVYP